MLNLMPSVINTLSSGGSCSLHWSADFIDKNISNLVSFENISFVWVPRLANRIAHSIGKWAARNYVVGLVDVNWLPVSFFVAVVSG